MKQVGDPLDVVDDPSTLGQDPGKGREAVVEEHQLGHRSRRRRARTHCDPHVGVLEREHVVDPVPGHGHGAAAGLQGVDHRPLLVGGHPPEHGGAFEGVGQVLLVLREPASVEARIRLVDPGPAGDGRDGGRMIPRDDLQLDTLVPEEGEDLGSVLSDCVLEHDQTHRISPRREVLPPTRGALGPGDQQHP